MSDPCSKGHTSGRRKNGNCIACEKARYKDLPHVREQRLRYAKEKRDRVKADPELAAKRAEYQREYSRKNREKLTAQSAERYRDPAVNIRTRLLRKGITPTNEIIEFIKNHDGRCTLCGGEPNDRWKTLAFDHCHRTGVFRGLLCGNCNKAIGLFQDDPDVLRRAIAYLEHYK